MTEKRHISIRANADMLDKFYYVSRYNGRSGSGQILFLMRSLIDNFEKEHGEITDSDIKKMLNK
jgi:hypothetical protein